MGHKIFLSPSDQTRNTYASGNTSEDVQCGKIAIAAKAALERCGFEVMLVQYATMAEKCAASDAFGAELHVPIHSNGFDGKVTGTRIFYHSDGGNGQKAAKAILARLGPVTPGAPDMVQAYPQLYEIRTPKAPTAYIEADFHDVAAVADWIIDNTAVIGEAICHGVCDYFGVAYAAEEKEDNEMRYNTLADIKADKNNAPYYLPTIEKLMATGILRGKGGNGDETIIDLGEDAVRVLVTLDRAGVYGE